MKTCWGVPKKGSFVISWLFTTFMCKRIDTRSNSGKMLTFAEPWSVQCFYVFKKRMQFSWTGLTRSSTVVYLDDENVPAFTLNLVQNLTNLMFFFLITTRSVQNFVRSKIVWLNTIWRHSEAESQEMDEDSVRNPKIGLFCHFLVIYNFHMQNDWE